MNSARYCLKCEVPWTSMTVAFGCPGSVEGRSGKSVIHWHEHHEWSAAEPPADTEWRKDPPR